MPFGKRNYEDVDRFSRFLHGLAAHKLQTDEKMTNISLDMQEREAIGGILAPIQETLRREGDASYDPPTATVPADATAPAGRDYRGIPGMRDMLYRGPFPSPGQMLDGADPDTGKELAEAMTGDPNAKLSVSARHNNPGNLKYAPWMKKYGAKIGEEATDGGHFAQFPSNEHALTAMSELLGPDMMYRDMDTEKALRTYSGKGYGADIYPEIRGKKMGDLTDQETEELIRRMVGQEGYHVGDKQLGVDEIRGSAGGGESVLQPGSARSGGPAPATAAADATAPGRRGPDLGYQTFRGMVDLLARGTEKSRQAAETLSRFDDYRRGREGTTTKAEDQYLGSETVDDNGVRKRVDLYGTFDAKGNPVVRDRKYQDFTPSAGGDGEGGRADKVDRQKMKDAYNKADERRRGYEQKYGPKLLSDWTDLLQQEAPKLFQLIRKEGVTPEEIGEALLQVKDPKLRQKLGVAADYQRYSSETGAYLRSLYDRGYDVDPDTGDLMPKERGRGVVGARRWQEEARETLKKKGADPDGPSKKDPKKTNLEVFLEDNPEF